MARDRPNRSAPTPDVEDAAVAPAARFAAGVWFTKAEVFSACQVLADADRRLIRSGSTDEARALGDLFELLEDRLSSSAAQPAPSAPLSEPGSYSSAREFTQ